MMKIKLLLPVMFLLVGSAGAQTTLQVVTQNVQKTVAWKPGYEVEINGEKAEVLVEPAEGNTVSVRAELSAKHPALDTAKADVNAWKFVVSTVGKKIYIRAYIGLPPGKPLPTSNLKAKITVSLPRQCPVNLRNKFGQARLDGLQGPVALSGEFCNFNLTNLGGKVQVDSRYGDVTGRNLGGAVQVDAKRADVSLANLRNDCSVRSEYGAVRVDAGQDAGNLTVKATKSDVSVQVPDRPRHNIHLNAQYGQVEVAKNLPFKAESASAAHWQQGQGRPEINVSTSFGKIVVE
ncbi:MAG: DUF4097 domain-containing protein [Thermoanaerobaculia bacterium]|nr:DUF4097 domain-containing protein [Thermoanaerobaculia bacterium]